MLTNFCFIKKQFVSRETRFYAACGASSSLGGFFAQYDANVKPVTYIHRLKIAPGNADSGEKNVIATVIPSVVF